MTEREEFTYTNEHLGRTGFGLIILGLFLMGLVLGTTKWEDGTPIMALSVVLGLPTFVLGLIELNKRGKNGVQVVVDADGITDFRLGPDPIPWAEVERCEIGQASRAVPGCAWSCFRIHRPEHGWAKARTRL